jgi:hypothetical protein
MTRRHELDPISLTFGLLFSGLGLLFLVGQADQALRLKWIWPLLLFAVGAAILLDVGRGRDRTEPQAKAEVEPTQPDTEGPVDSHDQPSDREAPVDSGEQPSHREGPVDSGEQPSHREGPVENREQRSHREGPMDNR